LDLAQAIRAEPNDRTGFAERVRAERLQLSAERDRLNETKQGVQQALDIGGGQLQELGGAENASESHAALELRQVDLRAELSALNNEWSAIDHRLQVLDLVIDAPEGLNARYDLRLPIVVPGGRTWLAGYYLLTGVHAAHLLAGIVVALFLVPLRLGRGRQLLLGNVAMYWNFVDVVWLVLFPIIYLEPLMPIW
jgi:hypothetical protein